MDNEPIITFTDKTVSKYQSKLYFGIRENVYYWSLKHRNIISVLETQISSSGVKTTMKKYIPASKLKFDYHLAEKLFEDMIHAIDYLNHNNILQSDIKPDNVYYDDEKDLFLLADFDLAYYGRESFINRTATPMTRPPELALIIAEENNMSVGHNKYYTRYEESARYRNKDKLITEKGDIFSLAVTVVTMLVGSWYPYTITEQIDRRLYEKLKYQALEKISNFKYINLLEKMLDFDAATRIGIDDIILFLQRYWNIFTVCRCKNLRPQRIMINDYNIYDIVKETLDDFRTSSPIIRREETSKLMTTYFSLRKKPPQDLYDFASVLLAALTLTGLLAADEELYFYYFDDVISYFLLTDDVYSHDEGRMPIHKLNIPLDTLSPRDFINKMTQNNLVIDICCVLEFRLLF